MRVMDEGQPAAELLAAALELNARLRRLRFAHPVAHVYNPWEYVWDGYEQYVRHHVRGRVSTLWLGMNPGPWGMAQTGVPFGEVQLVRDWLEVVPRYCQPRNAHRLRPVQGVDCPRSEVSGARLWGLIREKYKTPARFFRANFVANYCPLAFMEESARNRTPDKLPIAERSRVFAACNWHLSATVEILQPTRVVAIGQFAELRAREALGRRVQVLRILHPSPASPASNRDWAGEVTRQLTRQGVWSARSG